MLLCGGRCCSLGLYEFGYFVQVGMLQIFARRVLLLREVISVPTTRFFTQQHWNLLSVSNQPLKKSAAHDKLKSARKCGDDMTRLFNVSFSYGKRRILDNLSFSVGAGECVVLAGPNGSGKSTALSILAGIFRPDSGEVRTEGRIGYVPQGTALFEDMTVGDNLRFFAGMTGAAVQNPLPFDVERMWSRKVSKLSEGMKKRVSIAGALLGEPQLVLLDEPCASLDVEYKEELVSLVHELKKQGRAIVYVSHDPMEVASFYDKVVFFGETPVIYTREQLSGEPEDADVFYRRFLELFY